MRLVSLAGVLTLLYVTQASAQNAPPSTTTVPELETVLVTGVQPGPGMWKVSKGEHVLWVLGTLAPLPKHISWQSHDVESTIAKSQEVILPPEVVISAKVGFFGMLGVLPSLIGVRKNPDDAMLKDVVSADLYARWTVLKARYIGRSSKVETWRPIFAALDLYDAAIEKSGLVDSKLVQNKVKTAAKHARVKTTVPRVELALDDAKATIKDFKSTSLDDLDCFRKTLDRIDTDLVAMTARANAWATGDLDGLRQLPYTDQMIACRSAVSEASIASKHGMDDVDARVERAWLVAATTALDENDMTFAMLPISHLLDAEGYLSRLRAQGYVVEEPESAQAMAVGSPAGGKL